MENKESDSLNIKVFRELVNEALDDLEEMPEGRSLKELFLDDTHEKELSNIVTEAIYESYGNVLKTCDRYKVKLSLLRKQDQEVDSSGNGEILIALVEGLQKLHEQFPGMEKLIKSQVDEEHEDEDEWDLEIKVSQLQKDIGVMATSLKFTMEKCGWQGLPHSIPTEEYKKFLSKVFKMQQKLNTIITRKG